MNVETLHRLFANYQTTYQTAVEGILERAINHYFKRDDWKSQEIAHRCTCDILPMGRIKYYIDGQLICVLNTFQIRGNDYMRIQYFIPDENTEPHEVII